MNINFYQVIEEQIDKTEGLKGGLLDLLDKLLEDEKMSAEQKSELARLRARVAVELTAFE